MLVAFGVGLNWGHIPAKICNYWGSYQQVFNISLQIIALTDRGCPGNVCDNLEKSKEHIKKQLSK